MRANIAKKGASVGANCTVVARLVTGEYSLNEAGSLVADIPPYTVSYGNPSQQHGYVSAEGILLNMALQSKG